VCAVVGACSRAPTDSPGDSAGASGPSEASLPDVAVAETTDSGDAGRGALTKLAATSQTSVVDSPSWPESGKGGHRIGYLRHGAIAAAYDHPVVNADCKEGWYELEVGGFVCGKAVTTELTSPKIRLAPKQPDLDAGMPYRYGVNVSDGTPLYRRVLPTEERKKYEPWLVPAKPVADDADEKTDKTDKTDKTESGEGEESPRSRHAAAPADAGVDAGRPKLKSLKGRGVLVRTMARGFYLALDRSFNSNGARWWRTSFGFAVPFDRIMVQPGVTKHVGSWFEAVPVPDAPDAGDDAGATDAGDGGDGGDPSNAGTVLFVSVGFARKLELSDDAKKVTWGPELPKRSAVMLNGKRATVSGVTYHQTTSGFWVRMMDLTPAHPAFPADLKPNEKWVDVDLTRQALVAFEGTRPVFATLISSGRRNPQDKEKDFPTPTGSYRIREKHVTTTMDGDVASDGPYSIEDVPWVMYFQGSYALHAAFWHDSFGRMRSHGCVNMAPEDARTLFAWTDPPLPAGWHGVFSRDDASGTRIVVHEDPPQKHAR
jgi:lipoprotein-anchoring transpeptidase ErfK/SrfK